MPVENAEVEPENGKDIITNLDTYIQDVTENALMKKMVDNNSHHGTAIVMETATGKIKAIANLGKQANGSFSEDLNYGVGKCTEPGSVFKLATLLCLMEDKYVDKNSIVDCEGGVKSFHGLRIRDSHLGAGQLTVKEAFLRSSNVAFAKLADQYYGSQPSKFIDHLHRLHLDTYTGIDLTAASGKPTVKNPKSKSWSGTTIPYMAHGYEALYSPLHMLMLYNAVANNGKMMRPYLVNSIREYGITVQTIQPQVLVEQVARPEVIAQLQECMRAVVDSVHGTARSIKDSAYNIAGKTGTAVSALNNKGYNKDNKVYQSSFIGYFPAEKPQYTIAVVIQNTRESKLNYGGVVAAPVFKEISDKIYGRFLSTKRYTGTPSVDSNRYAFYGMKEDLGSIFSTLHMPFSDSVRGGYWRSATLVNNQAAMGVNQSVMPGSGIIPDVKGMGLKDAVYILENVGLKVKVSGKGKVFNQSIIAGTASRKGQLIELILN
jgi:cell division protein FtsI (penicillin-binding protein 3)